LDQHVARKRAFRVFANTQAPATIPRARASFAACKSLARRTERRGCRRARNDRRGAHLAMRTAALDLAPPLATSHFPGANISAREDAMKDEHFASALRRAGFDDIERKNLPPGAEVPEHAHPFDVRALVLDGEIRLTVEGDEYAYREGDIFVMPAGHRHAEQVGPAGVDYLVGRRSLAPDRANDPSRT
jgi:mannose-6-phosphate isomerase-like protein (cupin superfamily)